MSSSGESLDIFDEEAIIPTLAAQAIAEAASRARCSGVTLVELEGNQLVEVAPDGTRSVLKQLEPGTKVTPGRHLLRP